MEAPTRPHGALLSGRPTGSFYTGDREESSPLEAKVPGPSSAWPIGLGQGAACGGQWGAVFGVKYVPPRGLSSRSLNEVWC